MILESLTDAERRGGNQRRSLLHLSTAGRNTAEGDGHMAEQERAQLLSGIVAGVAGGLLASWVMNAFMENAGPKITETIESGNGRKRNGGGRSQKNGARKEDATMKTADAVVATVTGGRRHLSFEEKQKGGPIVHYAFGALMGGLYGALAEYSPRARTGFGTAFAGALFAGADLVAVPALHLSNPSGDAPVSTLATPFAAHLVYGVTTEATRRIVRAML